jgi:CheY-like chemotaxis protein
MVIRPYLFLARGVTQALELLLEKGERHDLILMDENFGHPDLMSGSEAIARLRARVGHEVVIIHCSGNNSEQQPPSDGSRSISSIAADDFWGKPVPDWRNGDMQRRLARLLALAQPKHAGLASDQKRELEEREAKLRTALAAVQAEFAAVQAKLSAFEESDLRDAS